MSLNQAAAKKMHPVALILLSHIYLTNDQLPEAVASVKRIGSRVQAA